MMPALRAPPCVHEGAKKRSKGHPVTSERSESQVLGSVLPCVHNYPSVTACRPQFIPPKSTEAERRQVRGKHTSPGGGGKGAASGGLEPASTPGRSTPKCVKGGVARFLTYKVSPPLEGPPEN